MSKLTLEQIRELATTHKQSPEERRAQRLSLIMGLRSHDSTLSREQAECLLAELEGHSAEGCDDRHHAGHDNHP